MFQNDRMAFRNAAVAMGISIENDEVEALARQPARKHGKGLTEIVVVASAIVGILAEDVESPSDLVESESQRRESKCEQRPSTP